MLILISRIENPQPGSGSLGRRLPSPSFLQSSLTGPFTEAQFVVLFLISVFSLLDILLCLEYSSLSVWQALLDFSELGSISYPLRGPSQGLPLPLPRASICLCGLCMCPPWLVKNCVALSHCLSVLHLDRAPCGQGPGPPHTLLV